MESLKMRTDKELEHLWEELDNIPTSEDEDGDMVIDQDFHEFTKGTDLEYIWIFFDENHSEGLHSIINGNAKEIKSERENTILIDELSDSVETIMGL